MDEETNVVKVASLDGSALKASKPRSLEIGATVDGINGVEIKSLQDAATVSFWICTKIYRNLVAHQACTENGRLGNLGVPCSSQIDQEVVEEEQLGGQRVCLFLYKRDIDSQFQIHGRFVKCDVGVVIGTAVNCRTVVDNERRCGDRAGTAG